MHAVFMGMGKTWNKSSTDMDHSAVYIQKTNDPMQQHVGVEGDASITWYVPSEENAWQHELCHSIQTRENTTADRDVGCCMANFYPILQLDWIQREINYKGGYGLSCMILVLSSCDLSSKDSRPERTIQSWHGCWLRIYNSDNWQTATDHVSSIIYHVQHLTCENCPI